METGEVIKAQEVEGLIPKWFFDPTVRAIRLAQWKKKRSKKKGVDKLEHTL